MLLLLRMGKVPLHLGQTVMSPERAMALPYMEEVPSPVMTVPPWLVLSPTTIKGLPADMGFFQVCVLRLLLSSWARHASGGWACWLLKEIEF